MGEILNVKIKDRGLVNRSDISGFIDNSGLDKKIKALVTKAKLEQDKQDKIVKLEAFNFSYFHGKSHSDDGMQNYFVFQPVYRYFKKIANSNHVSAWKSKR